MSLGEPISHFDSMTYSIYVDGELAPQEAAAVRAHLAVCPDCGALVRALEKESALVRAALVEEPAPGVLRARVDEALYGRGGASLWQAMLYAAAILAGIYTGIYYLAAALDTQALFEPLSWLDPTSSASWLDWLIRTFFYVYEEGWAMMLNSTEKLSLLAAGLLALSALLPWLRRRGMSILGVALATIALAGLFAPSASAVELRHVHGVVKVAKGEVIHDTLVVAGESVVVEGTVEGDLVAAGKRVEVRGEVKGDVIAAASNIVISGTVDNNVILAGSQLTLEGTVQRNAYIAGSNVELAERGNVLKAVFAAGSQGAFDGKIGDSLTAAFSNLQVAGAVAKDLRVRAARFTLLDSARVGGDLIVRTRQPAHIDPGAKVEGKKRLEVISARPPYLSARFYFRQLIWLLGFFIVGVLLLKLFPRFYAGATEAVGSIWRSLGLGIAVLAGVPVAAVIVAITLVGLPISLMSVAGYLTALYLAKIFVAAYLGRYLLKTPGAAGATSLGALFLGLAILTVAGFVPFLGALLRLVVLLAGLGALAWQLYQQIEAAPAA